MSLSINRDTDTYKATQVGKVAGVGIGSAYLLKNKEDIFVNTIKTSVQQFGSKKFGIIGATLAGVITLLATTGVGAVTGKLIGTVIDKIKFKKSLDNLEKSAPKVDFTAPVFDEITKKSV